ncbi:SAM-dependent methyltransferase [Flindersiella endophytica]
MSDESMATAPPGVDPNTPSVARIYDYMLGGTTNYEVDRMAAKQLEAMFPELKDWAWCNRGFHQRAARWLAGEAGITQFIDLGSGLPTGNNTHQVVQDINPKARVVYVDLDPMVAAFAPQLLADAQNVLFLSGDVRDRDGLLGDPDLRSMIDFDQPVALFMTAVVHFLPDESDPWSLVAGYLDAVPVGSYLALSHGTLDKARPEYIARVQALYANANEHANPRTKAAVERFFDGLELTAPYPGARPGVTYGGLWGAEDPEDADDEASRGLYCGVARKY